MEAPSGVGSITALTGQNSKQIFYPFPMHIFQPGDILDEDVYVLHENQYILYRPKNLPWTEDNRRHLDRFHYHTLYIQCAAKQFHNRFLEHHLSQVLDEPKIETARKAKILYTTSRTVLEDLFKRPESPENLKRSLTTIKHSIEYLSKDKNHFFELMRLATKNFSEYTHALHTAAYSIRLAQHRNIKSFNELSEIGVGALLHDIGKIRLPKQILENYGRLTENEWKEMKRHPMYGYEIVSESKHVTEPSRLIILHHHERENGSGYPRGLSGNDLDFFSRIVALADSFDLLTSDLPYQPAIKPKQTIERLQSELKTERERDLLIDFIKILKE